MSESKVAQKSESDVEQRGLSRKLLHSQRGFTVHQISGSISDLLSREVTISSGENTLLVSLSGSAVYVNSATRSRQIQPPEGAIFLRGPLKADVHYARGLHRWLEISWPDSTIQALSDWLAGEVGDKSGTWACHFDDHEPFLTASLSTLWDALEHGERNQEPIIIQVVSILIELALTVPPKGTLAAIPEGIPLPLLELMLAVKEKPTAPWSLKDAAAMAGYSAFHLSRTFRVAIEYGFPEFVDRCRTELALKELLETDESIEEVANKCGFGSTQALRSACREYVGFLPSEIRSVQIGLH